MEENQIEKVVVFSLGEEEFGIPIQRVSSIEKMQEITPLPQTANYVKGVLNLRDSVIPVIDLRKYLTKEKTMEKEETRIIVVEDEGRSVGFIVDKATDVMDISSDQTEEVTITSGEKKRAVKVAKMERGILILLDIVKILKEVDPEAALKEVVENVENLA